MNISRIAIASLTATAALTVFMLLGPLLGLPRMNIGELLGAATGDITVVGWIIHVIIGLFFGFIYHQFFNYLIPVENKVSRGAIYGIGVYLFSTVVILIINLSGALSWEQKGSMSGMVFSNVLGYLIYGAVLGSFFARAEKRALI